MSTPSLNTILIVEDDPDIQEIAILALQDFGGYAVESCSSGKEALEKAAQISPDLILLDVMMPEMDGPTTLENLRKIPETAATPILFLTARTQPNEVAEYLEKGALSVLKKPFDPVKLCQDIEEIWNKHHG